MRVRESDFETSATRRSEWPPPDRLEVAMCGRSNVGKSSLLNSLLGRKALARVSRTPGRTRLLNFFTVELLGEGENGQRVPLRIADLPGFGYAEVSRQERSGWQAMLEEYLSGRESLRAVVLLCDSRRALDAEAPRLLFDELELCTYLSELGRTVIPVLTKSDKLSKSERKPAAEALRRLCRIRPVIHSALNNEGTDELWQRLSRAVVEKPAQQTETMEVRSESGLV